MPKDLQEKIQWCEHIIPDDVEYFSCPEPEFDFNKEETAAEEELQHAKTRQQNDTAKTTAATVPTKDELEQNVLEGRKEELKLEEKILDPKKDSDPTASKAVIDAKEEQAILQAATNPPTEGRALIDLISELESQPDNLELRSGASLEDEISERLERLGQLTYKQGTFLQAVSRTFTNRLGKLVDYYKSETIKSIDTLANEQKNNVSLKEQLDRANAKIEKLEFLLKNSADNKRDMEEKVKSSGSRIEKLESILATEQELRKQADKRAKEALNTAARAENRRKQEQQSRAKAQAAAKKAVSRAREVMSYFFNSALDDTYNMGPKAKIMGGIPNFDELMLGKKEYF